MSAEFKVRGPVPEGMNSDYYAPVYEFRPDTRPILGRYVELVADGGESPTNVLRFPVIDVEVRFPGDPEDDMPMAA